MKNSTLADPLPYVEAFEGAWRALHITPNYPYKTELIELFYTLGDLVGEGEEGEGNMRHWLRTHNSHLGYCPAERLSDKKSLDDILSYLRSCNKG